MPKTKPNPQAKSKAERDHVPQAAPSVRTLWLLRHAKTVPDPPPGGRDRDRVLEAHGRSDAAALGALLGCAADASAAGLPADALPELVLCSSAVRTEQTTELVVAQLDGAPEVRSLSVLYNADPDDVVDQLRLVEDDVSSVMVIGHNPTMQSLATSMADADERTSGAHHQGLRFPTGALAVFFVPISSWSELTLGSATLLAHVCPPYLSAGE